MALSNLDSLSPRKFVSFNHSCQQHIRVLEIDLLRCPQYERAQNESQRQYVERERLLLQSSKLAAQLEEARDAQGKLAIEKDMLQKQLNVYRERVSRGDDKACIFVCACERNK